MEQKEVLFLIYVKNIPHATKSLKQIKTRMNQITQMYKIQILLATVNNKIEKFRQWLQSNSLFLIYIKN